MRSELLALAFSDIPLPSPLPNPMEPVCRILKPPVSHPEATLCTRRQMYATTVYHVIWAGLSEDTLTIPSVEEKTRTVSHVKLQGPVIGEREG